MDRKLYPLSSAERLMYDMVTGFPHWPQILNISALLTLQAPIDFEILRQALELEYARNESLRLRFTEPAKDGLPRQYIVEKETASPQFLDLSGKSEEEAVAVLQRDAAEPFARVDSPMHAFTMVKMPDGYNGIYVKMDHMITDSSAIILMINDVMEVYCHLAFGTPLPHAPTSYLASLKRDLQREKDQKRLEADRAFWEHTLDLGEPIYTDIAGSRRLREAQMETHNPRLRAAFQETEKIDVGQYSYYLEPEPAARLQEFCRGQGISMDSLLMMAIRTYLSKVNGGMTDITVRHYLSRRASALNRFCGGVRIHMYPCRTVLGAQTGFLEGSRAIQQMQARIYRHADFDPLLLRKMMAKRFHHGENMTYEGVALTYQPLPLRLKNERISGLPYKVRWLTNGSEAQPLYLTVMHTTDFCLEFYCRYQKNTCSAKDVELFYYYLMRILFAVVEKPGRTIGDVISVV